MDGDSKYTPLVLSMGVQVYKNDKGRYVVNTADLKQKVEKMLKKKGLIA